MLRLILLVVIVVVVVRLILRVSAQRKPSVQTAPAGVSVRGRGTVSFVGWDEIRQVDVSRMPDAGLDGFAVVLFGTNTMMIHESFGGFAYFAERMLERWPEIRSEWVRVQGGPPDISERVTVWERKAA